MIKGFRWYRKIGHSRRNSLVLAFDERWGHLIP